MLLSHTQLKMAAAALALLLLLLPAAAHAAPLNASRPCTNSYPPGLHEIELLNGRKFMLVVPNGLPRGGGRRVPGVIDWHGFSESPFYQNQLVGFEDILQKYRWIGALPFGTAPLPTETCCPPRLSREECEAGAALDSLNPCSFNVSCSHIFACRIFVNSAARHCRPAPAAATPARATSMTSPFPGPLSNSWRKRCASTPRTSSLPGSRTAA